MSTLEQRLVLLAAIALLVGVAAVAIVDSHQHVDLVRTYRLAIHLQVEW